MRLKILLLGGTATPGLVIERNCGPFQLEILRPADGDLLVHPPPHLAVVTLSRSNPTEDLKSLEKVGSGPVRIPTIAIAVQSSEELAIAAFRAGCTDYLPFPYTQDQLADAIQRCVLPGVAGEAGGKARLRTRPDRPAALIGSSAAMQKLKAYVARIAKRAATVLITGETGTGKDVVARLVHEEADARKPFISVNCAAIPETLIESELFGHERGAFTGAAQAVLGKLQLAEDGTLFLDEIGEMSLPAQAKLLRVIENRQAYRVGGRFPYPVRCRFIAASNCDLDRSIQCGRFRQDLFYRLNVARLMLPPLRERKEDIPELCAHFVAEMNHQFDESVDECDGDLLTAFLAYDWPGNVRELRNVFEAAYLNGPGVRLSMLDMPEWFVPPLKTLESGIPERDRLIAALAAARWNKSRAADALQWSRMTLYRKLAKYQIA